MIDDFDEELHERFDGSDLPRKTKFSSVEEMLRELCDIEPKSVEIEIRPGPDGTFKDYKLVIFARYDGDGFVALEFKYDGGVLW